MRLATVATPDHGRCRGARRLDRRTVADPDRRPTASPALPLPTRRRARSICCGLNYGDHIAETGPRAPGPSDALRQVRRHPDRPDGRHRAARRRPGRLGGRARRRRRQRIRARRPRRRPRRPSPATRSPTTSPSRDWQNRTLQWFQGKAWDATTPLGPVARHPDEIDPVAGVDVVCRVNGEQRQRDNTRTLVFDSADLLAYISTFTAAAPRRPRPDRHPRRRRHGHDPPRFLADGDVVETEIPGIGTLRNTVRTYRPDTTPTSAQTGADDGPRLTSYVLEGDTSSTPTSTGSSSRS